MSIIQIEEIAKVCHEANRAFCETLGDVSQLKWEDAPDWQRQSAINGVDYHLRNPGTKPSDSHDNWLREKLASGWKYGPVKNPEAKEHPCCVHYDELPIEQKVKDSIFLSIVRSMEVLLPRNQKEK